MQMSLVGDELGPEQRASLLRWADFVTPDWTFGKNVEYFELIHL